MLVVYSFLQQSAMKVAALTINYVEDLDVKVSYVLAIHDNGFPTAPSGIELGSSPPAVEAETCAVEQRCLDFLLTKIQTGKYGALMVELVLANAGLALRPQFVQQLAALTALYEVKLIVDECMSGFRCGFPSLALEYGIEPFAITFGKLHGAFALIRQETESMFQYDSEWTSIGGKLRERGPILMIHDYFRLSLFQQQVSSLHNICTKGELEGLTFRFQERIQRSIVAGNNQTLAINTAHHRKMKNGGPVLVWGLGLHLFCNYEIRELKKDAPGKAGWWTFDSGGVSFDFFGFRKSGSLDYPVALECMSGNWLLVPGRHFQHVEQQTVMYSI